MQVSPSVRHVKEARYLPSQRLWRPSGQRTRRYRASPAVNCSAVRNHSPPSVKTKPQVSGSIVYSSTRGTSIRPIEGLGPAVGWGLQPISICSSRTSAGLVCRGVHDDSAPGLGSGGFSQAAAGVPSNKSMVGTIISASSKSPRLSGETEGADRCKWRTAQPI